MINLLHHAKFIASAACVISIIDVPAVSCTLKQIDLQAFLLLQLPYCVSMLLLTSGCKLAATQYKRDIIWCLQKVF